MTRVNARAAEIQRRGEEFSESVRARRDVPTEFALLDRGAMAKNTSSRVHWLRRAADSVGSMLQPVAACRKGCAHCCAISVVVAESEAKVIGREIGRTPAKAPHATTLAGAIEDPTIAENWQAAMAAKYNGVACTFLQNNVCSIYEHRPVACRSQINIDRDALMCELVEGFAVPAPYVDMTPHKVRYLQVFGLDQRYADLRDWFPA